MSSTNGAIWLPLTPILMPFIYFSFLIFLAKAPSNILNKVYENEHLYFVPDYRINIFRLSLFSMILAVGLSFIAFIILRYIPAIFNLGKIFLSWRIVMKSCVYWEDHMVFVFILLMWFMKLINFECWTTFAFLGVNSS